MSTPATTVYSEPNTNGHANGEAESSKGASASDPSYHAIGLSSYIFNAGYMNQQWTDVQILFFDAGIKLHRVVLSRSPYLAQVMLNNQPGASIRLNIQDENITPEAVHIALHHLYSPAHHLVNSTNARPVLAAAYLFEGMPELVHHAYVVCRDDIDRDSVISHIQWLGSSSQQSPTPGTTFGSVSVNDGLTTAPSSEASEIWREGKNRGRYGEWSARLKQDIIDYLIRGLPTSLADNPQSLASNSVLLSIYAQLPFDLFKQCVENPALPITPTQNRFSFTKKAIAQRKKLASASQMEESVVLAVGEELGTVHVTHRPKRSRTALWKVEG